MEEERNEAPCFPPNYVSMALLRERWERKQIQTDNRERQRQRQMHHQHQRQEREKAERDRKQHEQDQRDQNNPKQTHTRDVVTPHPRNPRYQHHPKPEISQFEAVVLDDVAQKQQLKKKKKSNWDRQKVKGNEPRAEGEGIGGTAEVEPEERAEGEGTRGTTEVEAEERAERVVTEKMRGIEGPRTKCLGKGVDQRGHRWVEKQKVSGDDTTPSIVQNFESLSVNGGRVGNVRSQEGRNGNRRGFGRFDVGYEQPHRRRDDNFVWVKRGDGTDVGVNGVQCSGTFNMDQGNIRQKHSKELEAKSKDWDLVEGRD